MSIRKKHRFYVYVCLDPRKLGRFDYDDGFLFNHEPFYVGKGQGDRYKELLKCRRTPIFNNKVNKIETECRSGVISFKVFDGDELACFALEKHLIKRIGRKDRGKGPLLNMTDGGEGTSGLIRTKEHRRKLAESKLGSKNPMYGGNFTKEHLHKMSIANQGINNGFYGKKHSEETRKKMSKAWKNRGPVSLETREKLSRANKGKKMSEETRKKLSMAFKGKPNGRKGIPLSEEHKRKLSLAGKKRGMPIEVIRAAARARIGKPRSEETKRKISETLKRRFANA